MYTYAARAVHIVDGDTCDLMLDLGCDVHLKIRVRLYGLNAAEIHGVAKDSEEYQRGMKAKNFLEQMITNRDLIIKTHKDRKGKYGRYLAEIWLREDYLNKPSINQQLLENDLAVPYFGGKR